MIKMFGNEIELERKSTWYEIVMSLMVFLPCVLFGAIGGGLGFTNLIIIKKIDKWWLKLIISTQFTIISFLLSYICSSFLYLILF